MSKCAAALLGLGLSLYAALLPAAEVGGFFRVERSVTDQSTAEQERVAREGVRELMQRLSGRNIARDKPALLSAQQRSASLVQSFGFREPTAQERLLDPRVYVLQVDYDPRSMKQVLAQVGLAFWGKQRPVTALWLAMPAADGTPSLLSDGAASPLLQARLAQESTRRGLPLRLPASLGSLTPDDLPLEALPPPELSEPAPAPSKDAASEPVAEPRMTALKQASRTLRSEAVLAGAVSADPGGGFRGKFALLFGDKLERWHVSAASEMAALAAGLDGLSERLVRSNVATARPVATQRLSLQVNQVRSLADYGGLLRYLKGLSSLQAVTVQSIAGERVSLTLAASADGAALAQLFAQGQRLRPAGEAGGADALIYDWQP